ncbi:Tat pathway signal sequence domain protein [delta proteobacterium NaphS2]|nr:Tat pathway signal sequence domain protein [delta proteobacterium NaphS2]
MAQVTEKSTRRTFLKRVGAVGAGSIVAAAAPFVNAKDDAGTKAGHMDRMPKRPFGKTGVDVPILGLGGVLKMSDQLVFRMAYKMGVTYWDTADSYGWGKNEKAIGKYFKKFPEDRKSIFLVTKAATSDTEELTEKLHASFQKMNTSYVDLYFIHYVSDVKDELTPGVKAWAEKAKSQGKIRFFGFSAHKNMEASMLAAAKLGWIDGIMMSYNYRLMVKDEMKRAVEACVKAGIGLTAMKTQAAFTANFYASIGSETDDALNMTENFMKKGYTAEQAKLKVVWENPDIASICSAMPNMTILQANVAAATNREELSGHEKALLDRYAAQTCSGYCAGCADICESALDYRVPISDLLRCSMYHFGYGDREKALELLDTLPPQTRASCMETDFSPAEHRCPQNIAIGRIVKTAIDALT